MVAKVRAAAESLGYVADAMARSLKVRRTEQLALAVADLGNPVYVTMMRAIEGVVSAAGYRLVVMATGAETDTEIETIRGMSRGYADGLIISPLRITPAVTDELLAARVPVVVIGSLPPSVPLDNVRANSVRGIGLGLRPPGRGRSSVDRVPQRPDRHHARRRPSARLPARRHGEGRQAGRARDRLRRRLHRGRRREGGPHPALRLPAGRDHLRQRPARHRCDARPAGGRATVPGDVAVVGMDNTELAELTTPTLTSVCLGSRERGMQAATLLLDRLRDPDRAPSRVTVQPRLVERDSTATPSLNGATRTKCGDR